MLGASWDNCISGHSKNFLPLPPGYELAANDVDSVAVIAAHGWSTTCVVLADGSAWRSANHGRAGEACALSSANSLAVGSAAGAGDVVGYMYSVTRCNLRVLTRCA